MKKAILSLVIGVLFVPQVSLGQYDGIGNSEVSIILQTLGEQIKILQKQVLEIQKILKIESQVQGPKVEFLKEESDKKELERLDIEKKIKRAKCASSSKEEKCVKLNTTLSKLKKEIGEARYKERLLRSADLGE